MITEFSCMDTWLMLPENCLVIFKNGTMMLMLKDSPEMLTLGAPLSRRRPLTRATITYSTLPMLFRIGMSMLA